MERKPKILSVTEGLHIRPWCASV